MKRGFLPSVCVLLLNAAYLYSFDSPSVFYVFNVFLHAGGGLLLTLALWRITRASFRDWRVETRLAAVSGLLAGLSGLLLIYTGTSTPYLPWLTLHIVLSIAAAGLFLAHLLRNGGSWIPMALALAVALTMPGAVKSWRAAFPDPLSRISNPVPPPTSLEGETAGPDSPFFPSAARTDVGHTIPSEFFMKPERLWTGRLPPGHL